MGFWRPHPRILSEKGLQLNQYYSFPEMLLSAGRTLPHPTWASWDNLILGAGWKGIFHEELSSFGNDSLSPLFCLTLVIVSLLPPSYVIPGLEPGKEASFIHTFIHYHLASCIRGNSPLYKEKPRTWILSYWRGPLIPSFYSQLGNSVLQPWKSPEVPI